MTNQAVEVEKLVSVERLTRDLASAATTLTDDEARYMVDTYYAMQKQRIRASNQVRALGAAAEPNSVVHWLAEQSDTLEGQVKRALDKYSNAQPLGQWARDICGIGPVIAAGLLSHIDIKVPSIGSVWRFAGLDPTSKWEKGQKRPHNASLKTLCWKIGESFVKVSGNEKDIYGKFYLSRKEYELAKNERGDYAEKAAQIVKDRPTHKQIAIYKTGKLPPGHIHMRCERYATKLFLAHYWEMGRKLAGLPVPLPYPIQHLGHVHKIEPPAKDSE